MKAYTALLVSIVCYIVFFLISLELPSEISNLTGLECLILYNNHLEVSS